MIEGKALEKIWENPIFFDFGKLNILPLIYDEEKQQCNILVRLFSHALIATSNGHEAALEILKKDIEAQKKGVLSA